MRHGEICKSLMISKVGRQYIEDTTEVQQAKERFFKFFQFAVDGLLYK